MRWKLGFSLGTLASASALRDPCDSKSEGPEFAWPSQNQCKDSNGCIKLRSPIPCISVDICIARNSTLPGYNPNASRNFGCMGKIGLGNCLRPLDATYGCECRNSVCKGKPAPRSAWDQTDPTLNQCKNSSECTAVLYKKSCFRLDVCVAKSQNIKEIWIADSIAKDYVTRTCEIPKPDDPLYTLSAKYGCECLDSVCTGARPHLHPLSS